MSFINILVTFFLGFLLITVFCRSSMTTLSYEVNVIPRFSFPAIFLERIISSDLPVNLQALACRAEKNFAEKQNVRLTENTFGSTYTSANMDIDGALSKDNKIPSGEVNATYSSSGFGPLSQSSTEVNSNWGVFGKVCKLDRPVVDEVHLRRFDGLLVFDLL